MSEPCIQAERIIVHGMEIDGVNKDLERHVKIFEKHIETGKGWRIAVAGTALVLLFQIGTAIYFYGRLAMMVENHEKNIQRLEIRILK